MADSEEWQRPASVPYPSFQKKYLGRKPTTDSADGKPQTYLIQEIPSDRHEEAIRLMAEFFASEEVMMSVFGVRDDPEALAEIKRVWRKVLSQGLSVCAMLENPDGSAGPMVGLNLLQISRPGKKLELQSDMMSQIMNALESKVKPDVYQRYGVSEMLSAFGMVVVPAHRGQGLGEQLLRARWDLGRALGLRATTTIFSGKASQLVAERAGFEPLAEVRYADTPYPELHKITSVPSMIYMGAKLD